ncbi:MULTISPECIES: hypothetical protein [Pectobacterium]|uniref:Uncharacterized protein n=1 Tax=Pectobacterium aroidearum TaxID=1201031 RepID=A0AAW3SZW2_9GAMM|nr:MULTISPECIES: hypothetical protein [Pectobacterium]MBA5205228.1 hypothetical protein [Pectobacterium aroidearum]MBA5236607.1 hypothetical protein [Pectobacterium aroidearum]QPI43200.1 hypothetical protein I2D83_00675 [Pectobacterium aroidearum]UUE57852.1 hypothetical protein L0Y27_00640 [Pectobacterium aroidearum]UUE70557.1 hypothetical protein L0Y21_00640 [Pectobacterium aroidearum]
MDNNQRNKWNNSLKTNIQDNAGRYSLYHAILAGDESGESPLTLHEIAENKKRNQNSSSSPPPSQQRLE